jgi:hypothetical protein
MTAAISDYAIEAYYNWTLLHALGGSNSVLEVLNPLPGQAEPEAAGTL